MGKKTYMIEKPKKKNIKRDIYKYLLIIILSIFIAFLVQFLELGAKAFIESFSVELFLYKIFAFSGVIALLIITFFVYVRVTNIEVYQNKNFLLVLFTSVAITFMFSIIFSKFINIYSMPLILAGLLICELIDKRVAIISNIFICLTFFLSQIIFSSNNLISKTSTMIIGIVAGTVLVLIMDKTYTRMKFLIKGFFIGLLIAIIPLLMTFLENNFQAIDILFNSLWAFLSILIAVALFLIFLPIYEKIFKLTTNFGLEEICSFNNSKLLKRLSKEAPGTFNHSLSVGNLAQLCAIAIDENPQLAKAAAYYHDVGKLQDPLYYVENQKDYNPHDDCIPEVSVNMIIKHTEWGYKLIKKANLPDIIADIAKEHHGTSPINYFYYKVQKMTEQDVERTDFCYPGPIPSSKIAAIIMIVDTIEAATRAAGITLKEEKLRETIHNLIDEKRKLGQFDNTNLTFKEIKKVEDTLVKALPSIYHHRIAYDKD